MKFASRTLVAEAMRHFGPEFFDELVYWYKTAREVSQGANADAIMEAHGKLFTVKVLKRTGINAYVEFNKRDPSVVIPEMNKNNALFHPWVKTRVSNKGSEQFLKEAKSAYGYVDHVAGTVGGCFSQVPIKINMPIKKLKDKDIPVECLVAATLHEIGHIYVFYAFLSRTYYTNLVLQGMHEKMANRPTGDQKFTIIAKSINDINPKATIDSDVFKDIDDPEVISVALLSEAVNDSVHELGHNVYDYTNWESLADDYATRHGAGPWLARMLDQVYSQSFNISGRPLPVFLLFEALKIFSLLIPPLGIFLILQDSTSPLYDGAEARLNRIRNTMLDAIDLDKTLTREDITRMKSEMEVLERITADYKDRRQLGEVILWLLSKENRKNRRYMLTQRELEDLANHTLKLRMAEFNVYKGGN